MRIGPALRYGVVTMHGKGEIVAGTVMMLIGENSREVVRDVKIKLEEIKRELPEGVQIKNYYDRADFIERMLTTVGVNLAEGAALVIAILFLTLGSLRGSLLAALAIPLSMGVAVIGMRQLGVTGNLMSLGAIDFGLLVDGAIVMLEGTLHTLEHERPARADVPRVVAQAMKRAAKPVTFAVAIIMLVYLPLMALEGVEGRMFRPMAITVAVALGGALLFTLTTFPAACAYALRSPKPRREGSRGVFERLGSGYGAILEKALRRPSLPLTAAAGALVLAIPFGAHLGAEFVPRLDEGEFALDVRRLPSVGIQTAQNLAAQVEEVLARFPEAETVVTRLGRAEVATDPCGPDESAVRVKLKPTQGVDDGPRPRRAGRDHEDRDRGRGPRHLRRHLAADRGPRESAALGLARRPGDQGVRARSHRAQDDRRAGRRRAARGAGDRRPARAAHAGAAAAGRLGRPAAHGPARHPGRRGAGHRRCRAGRHLRGQGLRGHAPLRRHPAPAARPGANPESIGEVPVGTSSGMIVPLSQVAKIEMREGPATINREAFERRLLVESNVRGRDLVSYVNESRAKVEATVKIPQGYHLVWAGQFENFTRAKNRLALVVPVALAIIFGMLFLMFGELRTVICVFACVPLGLVGGIIALAIRGLPFSIPAAVGFIALAGVAVLNGVVMASELQRRLRGEGSGNPYIESAVTVLRPVITTALVAAIGFLPMALSTRAGAEVQRPLATVVIGGILSSTLLSLFVLPTLLKLLAKRRPLADNG